MRSVDGAREPGAVRLGGELLTPVPALALPRFRFEGYDLSRSRFRRGSTPVAMNEASADAAGEQAEPANWIGLVVRAA